MHVFRAIHRAGVLSPVVIAGIFCCVRANAQQPTGNVARSKNTPLRMNVDEVVITFNAADGGGALVRNLKQEEIRIRDNGVAPRRVVAFEQLRDRPLRAGFLLDTSESMRESLPGNKVIAKRFVELLFRHGTDSAFVSSFGYGSEVLQAWSDDPGPLKQSIQMARPTRNGGAGTAILNAVFQACSSSFAKVDPTASGNFIVLFSDGQDNAGDSLRRMKRLELASEATRRCSRLYPTLRISVFQQGQGCCAKWLLKQEEGCSGRTILKSRSGRSLTKSIGRCGTGIGWCTDRRS